MIPNRAVNGQDKGLITSLAKKCVSLLPPSAPGKIYNATLKIPIARQILTACIRTFIPEKIDISGLALFLDRNDVAVSGALALGRFESFETKLFRETIRPGMKVADIGSHIGYYALIAGKQTGTSGRVFAFEPEPRNFRLLEKNVAANNLSNISISNIALSESAGKRTLFLEKDNRGHHSFAQNNKQSTMIDVVTETLDGSLDRQGSLGLDVIKIDVEGAEPIVLRGMKKTIEHSTNLSIFTEVYPLAMARLGESAVAYLESLKTYGFALSTIDEDSSALLPITDIRAFIDSIPSGESFKNVYGSKRPT